ncbi:hypothetical protein F5883DRAFT_595373 [Diaporthe sp. PMI_573]|nr:hypothetical protein F5883DRAFT_595373 [Diaporthaceae sp. PMI_573]
MYGGSSCSPICTCKDPLTYGIRAVLTDPYMPTDIKYCHVATSVLIVLFTTLLNLITLEVTIARPFRNYINLTGDGGVVLVVLVVLIVLVA